MPSSPRLARIATIVKTNAPRRNMTGALTVAPKEY